MHAGPRWARTRRPNAHFNVALPSNINHSAVISVVVVGHNPTLINLLLGLSSHSVHFISAHFLGADGVCRELQLREPPPCDGWEGHVSLSECGSTC